ncbi:DUF1738 domain-containing protein [Acetobacter sacchari]|uniref:DUF1738 domain-containing protein n=1 Tax=Acetobacter sacchari TaxID=2661687 RepID=A0ABS3LWM3_9PROT|nr:zincin-like metallopeptidase domain-containing protein [Acetobacter sacchari]MBO1360271.1 DUF1738 domain-containing protein [Acetobacter sacchari]
MPASPRADLYQEVTDRIIRDLEGGIVPWVQPWSADACGATMPRNITTGRKYSGVNVILLWVAQHMAGFRSQRWLTFRQAIGAGGAVRKGERGTTVCYADRFTPGGKSEDPDARTVPFLKRFTVFNVEQCDGLPDAFTAPAALLPEREAIPAGDALLSATRADIRIGGDKAFYAPKPDFIAMPPKHAFAEQTDWYSVAFHETIHWSGSEKILNRDLKGRFGDSRYSAEELIAEIESAFLAAELGISPTLRHADYIGSWLNTMKSDRKAIFTAARLASQAADYVLSLRDGTACPDEPAALAA